MSDYMKRDMPTQLWTEILERHWRYMEMEENAHKLEERKKLDACLKDFLCIVPHDRKFFLLETLQVLKKSICELKDFSAFKAMKGFDSISQYANNLFTKPWRKEYRTLKLYSGYYQHEIVSHLVDAEQLFEAMGYRRLSDDILVLDGPICPDQVTNVSRDAMTAYMECDIINQIYSACVKFDFNCSWLDIYDLREKIIGGCTKTLEVLTFNLQQERRSRKEKQLNKENCYASIQHMPTAPLSCCAPTTAQCGNCNSTMHIAPAHDAQYGHGQRCKVHPLAQQDNIMCNNGMEKQLMASYPAGNYRGQAFAMPATAPAAANAHMSHSRSLEHYNEPPHALLPHRHSLDYQQQGCATSRYNPQLQQQHVYESPYDCLDGAVAAPAGESSIGSSASYSTVMRNSTYAQPDALEYAQQATYNVSGNRYPLPFNVANQFGADYATPAMLNSCNGLKAMDAYANVESPAYARVHKTPGYSCSGGMYQQEVPLPPVRRSSRDAVALKQQRSFPPDHLIDFDDRAPLTKHDFHEQHRSFDCDRQQELLLQKYERRAQRNQHAAADVMYAQPQDMLCYRHAAAAAAANEPMYDAAVRYYDYAKPVPSVGYRSKKQTDSYIEKQESMSADNNFGKTMQQELLNIFSGNSHAAKGKQNKLNLNKKQLQMQQQQQQHPVYQNGVGNISDMSCAYDYHDDFVNVAHSEKPAQQHTQLKDKEGVGSYEQWDHVYQRLERLGYNKNLDEREDLQMKNLDLSSLNLTNESGDATENSGSNNIEKTTALRVEKARTLEKTDSNVSDKRKAAAAAAAAVNSKMLSTKTAEKEVKTQSQSKATVGTNTYVSKSNKSALKQNKGNASNNSNAKTQNNANNNLNKFNDNSKRNGNASKSSERKNSAAKSAGGRQAGDGSAAASNGKEWGCLSCTYINKMDVQICDMCSRTKGFLPPTVPSTPTCV